MKRPQSFGSRALETRSVKKVWGRDALPPPFASPAGQRIGEIWFEPPPELDELLIKYLFTSEKLSVQVHPPDSAAPPGARGKEECWLILDAEPGARLAVGFRRDLSRAAMRAAALDGSIERLLAWHEVRRGDFFYLRAGTVHAIGAGISLIEIQQNSDVTYRLFDYGRPRALHIDEAVAVATGGPADPAQQFRVPANGTIRLVGGPHFRLHRIDGPLSADIAADYRGAPLLVVPIDTPISLAGETLAPGCCGLALEIGDFAVPRGARALVAQPVIRP